jgi:hypothetical protein
MSKSHRIRSYFVPKEVSDFYINGVTLLKINKTEFSDIFFKSCENLNNNLLDVGYEWKEHYKTTEDLIPSGHSDSRPSPFNYPFLLDFIFDQEFNTKINELTGHELILGDMAVRRTMPSSKSYMRWHRDTHFYKNKEVIGRFPPIYKIILYVPSEGSRTNQISISPGGHLRFMNNRYLDIMTSIIRKKMMIKSSFDECMFFNTFVPHSVIQKKKIIKKPSIRIIYNFCLKSQLKEFPGKEELHNLYLKKHRQFSP